MYLRTDDPIYRARINLVAVGDRPMPLLAPASVWAMGIAIFLAMLIPVGVLFGLDLVTVTLTAVAAGFAGKRLMDALSGERTLRGRAHSLAAEVRSARRRRQVLKPRPVIRSVIVRSPNRVR